MSELALRINQEELQEIEQKFKEKKLGSIEVFDSEDLTKQGAQLPPLKKLFGKYIFEGTHVILGAERGSGKSYLAMQLCLAVSGGHSHFLGEPIELHGNTLILDFELGPRLNSERFMHLYLSLKKVPEKYRVKMAFPRGSLSNLLMEVQELIRSVNPVLVVIDNLKTAFNGRDLQKGTDAIEVMTELNMLSKTMGFAILSIAHTKKNTRSMTTNSDLISGSGSINDLADADFFLRKGEQAGERILKRDKSRICEETDKAKLIRMNPDSRWFELIYDDIDEMDFLPVSEAARDRDNHKATAKELKAQGQSLRQIADQLPVSKSTIERWLNE